jgi:N-acetylglucosamine-6-phosphate deacetylase
MVTALINGRILSPTGWRDGAAVLLDGGRILDVVDREAAPQGAHLRDLRGATLVPGFIDTQVNGGGGVLFNDTPTVEAIARIGEVHRRFGTTGFLPTLLSDDLAIVDRAMRAVEAAIEQGVPGVLGIHIEGPFLNAERKGIHDQTKLRTLDEAAFNLLTSLKRGKTMVTLAPETTSREMIARLSAANVVLSAGHTNASYEDIQGALNEGLTGFTHLFNAMSPLMSRAPGVVGAALESQTAWCGLILDGRHVSPVVLRLALRTRPLDRFMLVSDAMPTVGNDDNTFQLGGRLIRAEGGACVAQDGTLAGSNLDMALAVRNAVDLLGVTLAEAVTMASAAPAAFLGLSPARGVIAQGAAADLVLLSEDGQVLATWIGGEENDALGDEHADAAAMGVG